MNLIARILINALKNPPVNYYSYNIKAYLHVIYTNEKSTQIELLWMKPFW